MLKDMNRKLSAFAPTDEELEKQQERHRILYCHGAEVKRQKHMKFEKRVLTMSIKEKGKKEKKDFLCINQGLIP